MQTESEITRFFRAAMISCGGPFTYLAIEDLLKENEALRRENDELRGRYASVDYEKGQDEGMFRVLLQLLLAWSDSFRAYAASQNVAPNDVAIARYYFGQEDLIRKFGYENPDHESVKRAFKDQIRRLMQSSTEPCGGRGS